MVEPFSEGQGYRLYLGDCVEKMRSMPEDSVDAVVTDPPYGLEFMGKEWDRLAGTPGYNERGRITVRPDSQVPYGRGGGVNSYQAGQPMQAWHEAWAREALRVLKPGGFLLAFGGTRTVHRLVCAIEDAGFEIRDSITWLYGSGFPKSLDVSKAIDKLNGRTDNEQKNLAKHIKERRQLLKLSRTEVNNWFGYVAGCQHWESMTTSNAGVPTLKDWLVLKEKLCLSDEFTALVERIEAEREVVGELPWHNPNARQNWMPGKGKNALITAPATEAAKQWEGFGTALKPAHEPIVVARKPLSESSVARNVLEHGTGALAIDASRVEGKRWPANALFSHSPECNGECVDGCPVRELGEPARFFYCAKSSRAERNKGLEGMPEKVKQVHMRSANGTGKKNFEKWPDTMQQNTHPTVKPLALMRYLVKLVTPPGGVVLDPFAGSGSTLVAAIQEGFEAIGIEQEEEYAEICAARCRLKPSVVNLATKRATNADTETHERFTDTLF